MAVPTQTPAGAWRAETGRAGSSENLSPVASLVNAAGQQGPPPQGPSFRFGKYQLFATLGRGGMADVFLAVAHGPMGFNKLTVIKRLKPILSTEPSFRQMFLDEARLAARLAHPHVVHTYEVGEEEGAYFLAMEYIEGQSLNRVIKQTLRRGQRIDPLVSARIVADALDGLAYAHELTDYDGRPLSVIHRDVSPHNLLLGYDGNVKVVDFGIAKAASSSTETEIGVLKGKVAYMAPEQASGLPIDARADLFPMGIVFWELLTHKRLLAADTAAVTLHRLMNERIPRVSEHVPSIDPRLDDIVARALEKDPRDRWPSARAFRDALDEVLSTSPRLVRHEEVSRFVSEMFAETRDEVHRRIQAYMATIAPDATGAHGPVPAISTLTQESLRRLQQGQGSSEQLLLLGVSSGSGSGVIPRASTAPSLAPPERKRGLALVLLATLLGVALLVILLLVLRTSALRGAPEAANPMMAPVLPATATGTTAGMAATPGVSSLPVASAPSSDALVIPSNPNAGSGVSSPPAVGTTTAPTTTTARVRAPAPPSADQGGGFLTFDTYPWTKVTEGGRVLGTTPLVHVALPAGAHTLTLDNADQGIHQTYEVTVKSGDTVSRRLGLK